MQWWTYLYLILKYIHGDFINFLFVVVQSLSRFSLFVTPWTTTCRFLCPPLSPWVCSNSGPLSHLCYLTISSSAALFSFCHQTFPASGSFPMSQLILSDGQSIGASASASVLAMNIYSWFLSPCSPRDSQESSPAPQFENINSLALSLL